MMKLDIEEIIGAIAKHNIRWIRKNFYTDKYKEELSVDILLAELPEFNMSQNEGKKAKHPNSLIDFFNKHYANSPKQIEELKEKLVKEFIDNKRILLLHENLDPQIIVEVKKVLLGTPNETIACETFELSEEPENLVELLKINGNFNFAILCLTNSNDKFAVCSMLMFLIGYFGVENICVIYNNEDEKISKIAKKLGISYDSFMGLGLRWNG